MQAGWFATEREVVPGGPRLYAQRVFGLSDDQLARAE